MSYHIKDIPKGVNGESSKIMEELLELIDAEDQGCKIMALVELSDLVGAVSLYLERYHPGVSLYDLTIMSNITARAFKSGHRK